METSAKGINVQALLSEILAKELGIKVPHRSNPDAPEITTNTVESDETQTIIIPTGMSKKHAAKELERQWEEEETEINMALELKEWNSRDAVHAIMIAMERTFGWINAQSSFWSTPMELQIVTNIENGKITTKDAFLGEMKVSSWDDAECTVGIKTQGGRELFAFVVFNVKKKHKERVKNFFSEIREILLKESIFKGKSVLVDSTGFHFIENKVNPNIILNEDEERIVENLVIRPLKKTGKRAILFTGKYGTGKTETAMRVGKAATDIGTTFFYLKDPSQFAATLESAKQYAPSLIFMEDIDEIGSGEDRDTKMNELLNTLDGVQTKGSNLTVIFTTNHENRINKALRRPGRIDLIVRFKEAQPETSRKIYQALLKNANGYDKLDMDLIVSRTPVIQGAVVAEIGKRSLDMADEYGELSTDIVLTSIDSMNHQIAFMEAEPENVESDAEKLFNAMKVVAAHGSKAYNNDEISFCF